MEGLGAEGQKEPSGAVIGIGMGLGRRLQLDSEGVQGQQDRWVWRLSVAVRKGWCLGPREGAGGPHPQSREQSGAGLGPLQSLALVLGASLPLCSHQDTPASWVIDTLSPLSSALSVKTAQTCKCVTTCQSNCLHLTLAPTTVSLPSSAPPTPFSSPKCGGPSWSLET